MHHPARRARRAFAASTSTRRISRATFRKRARSTCAIVAGSSPADDLRARGLARGRCRGTPLDGDAHNLFADRTERPARPTCGCESFRTAAWRGSASTATSSPTGRACARAGDVDLAAAEHGGARSSACSDMFFGSRHNLIMPGDATHMGDGWETKRRRGPGHDWTIIRLGRAPARRARRGRHAALQGQRAGRVQPRGHRVRIRRSAGRGAHWLELLPRTPLQPHARQTFEAA